MEEFGRRSVFDGITHAARKKRTQTSRRPRPDSQSFGESCDPSPLSSTPASDDVASSKVSSDENTGFDTSSKRKKFNLNHCMSRASLVTGAEVGKSRKKSKEDGGFNAFYNSEPGRSGSNNKRSSEGVLAPANWKSTSKEFESRSADIYNGSNGESQSLGNSVGIENKVKKVKLKVGGVTRTIHANSSPNGVPGVGHLTMSSRTSEDSRPRHKQNLQGYSDDSHSPSDKRIGLQGIPWKDFSRGGFSLGKEDSLMGKMSGKNSYERKGDQSASVRKSKRVPKRRVLDGEFGEDDEDDEIRYLEKLKTSKIAAGYKEDDDEEASKKQRKLSKISSIEYVGRSVKDGKKPISDIVSEDFDYEEEELVSESELEGTKKQKKESIDSLMDSKREMTLTTRQRALQSSKDASAVTGSSLIEFPNGLPPAPPRKQKEKLTEVEQQVKKAEAAQRRRMQVEKAARESEAEAIRKILGQDSSRKKREEKIKKRQVEMAQEKAANAEMHASSTIRWVMGPNGTVVTFPKDMILSIFDPKPCSYPPPREKCAGPSCCNPYKYRDSKSKLPLCSLQCYKAIQGQP
ncbi:zf-HIT domain-containing protein/PAPA-1 domain-containing protein [Cephalotus follicularis]|uniref:Zf-HIT domain-containing protein/PAPA-1 domain-containing protein n=1 Tax=Cephalotus follicularis TaxID=3775 RepID=A0A1Q3CTX1_CEPFO|nr:zf-HIT domain-containing protein/PAPA-1 domain-containing protein [Cephalotus follicularis]